jgi:CBS domain-containing protein
MVPSVDGGSFLSFLPKGVAMLVREIMTHGVQVVPPGATLEEAAKQMKSLDTGALPVCEGNKLVGMITDRDITVRGVAGGRDPHTASVREAMTGDLVFCYEDESVEHAARIMEERQIRRLPILNRSMQLVGILSLGDLATRRRDNLTSGEVLKEVSKSDQMHA